MFKFLFSFFLLLSTSWAIVHLKQEDSISFSDQITCQAPLSSDLFLEQQANGSKSLSENCFQPANGCLRKIIDGYFSDDDINQLLAITKKGKYNFW